MDSKRIFIKILILLVAILSLLLVLSLKETKTSNPVISPPEEIQTPAVFIGEKITYDLSAGWLYLGQSTFTQLPDTELEAKDVSLATFETKIRGFYDLERIYSDRETFLPLRVMREIKGWGMNEQITEEYNQKDLILTFTKYKGTKKEVQITKANCPIHNAVILPFYLRRIPEPEIGWSLRVCIPEEFTIRLAAIEEVKVPAGKFKAYLFKSIPKNFEIWVSADVAKIPLKIKSMGSTMEMKERTLFMQK